jgi:hypothetical protein
MATQEGAEAFGAKFPTGTISSEQRDQLVPPVPVPARADRSKEWTP